MTLIGGSTLNALTSRMTCEQIVLLAERSAGNPGLHLTLAGGEPATAAELLEAPAYAHLQLILDHLSLVKTFTWSRTALNFNISSLHNELPPAFWRVGFSDPCWISEYNNQATTRGRFTLLDAQEFHSLQNDGLVGRPLFGYINRNSGVMTVNPEPDQLYLAELHYYPYQAAIASIDDYPWFPYGKYLVNALLCDLYLHQDDTRWQIANAERTAFMKQISGSMGDERDRSSAQVELDSRLYSRPMEL